MHIIGMQVACMACTAAQQKASAQQLHQQVGCHTIGGHSQCILLQSRNILQVQPYNGTSQPGKNNCTHMLLPNAP
jgi:hypothetical protein